MAHTRVAVFSTIVKKLRKRKRAKLRQMNLDAVEKLGYKPRLISAAGQVHLYSFVDDNGKVYDNDGVGFSSSSDLLAAAQAASSNLRSAV